MLGLYRDGVQQVEEASEMYKRLGDTLGQAGFLRDLARFLLHDERFDAAEDAVLRSIDFIPENCFALSNSSPSWRDI